MSVSKIAVARNLLKLIGTDPATDRIIADAIMQILEDDTPKPLPDEAGGVETELEREQPEIKKTASEKTDAEKKRPAAKKKTPFDTGKMIALLRAGWNVPKVADEMGVSEATIYNHMKKEGITIRKDKDK